MSDDKDAIGTTRSILLFLLSMSAVGHAVQAWEAPSGQPALVFALWALPLGVALVAGEVFAPDLESIEEVRRERFRLFGSVSYLLFAVPALVAGALRPDAALVPMLVTTLAALHPLFLLTVGLGRDRKGALASALVLSLLACLRGGFLAVTTAVSTVTFLGGFLVFDHHFRTLSTYPTGPGTWLGLAMRGAARTVLPGVLGLVVVLGVSPPRTAPSGFGSVEVVESQTEVVSDLLMVWIGGAVAVYVAGRLIPRARRKAKARLDVVEPLRGGVERLPLPPPPPATPVYPGRRGLIVRAYLRFLEAAARTGIARRPSATALEFALVVKEPAEPLEALTKAFVRARYAPAEPTPDDVLVAESGADILVRAMAARRSRQPAARLQPGTRSNTAADRLDP